MDEAISWPVLGVYKVGSAAIADNRIQAISGGDTMTRASCLHFQSEQQLLLLLLTMMRHH
jgi:hypothetical protein